MTEEEIKQTIEECKIEDLKQLAIMFNKKEVERFDIMQAFKHQTKEALEQQLKVWQSMLEDLTIQFEVSKELSSMMTEENQNDIFAEGFTIKEVTFMSYQTELRIDYYSACVELIKKIIKNKQ